MLAAWVIAIVIGIVLVWGLWAFLKRSEHPARNNPGVDTSSVVGSVTLFAAGVLDG